tara:strand:+ start:557 stop:1252 length:696 start_codon:yes stop_codon:yes gene_type:complete
MRKIDLYADGLQLQEFDEDFGIEIDGYTFNPSIFKKNGAKDYLDYSKKILNKSKNKPVSLEVFADDEKNMVDQAKKLNSLAENVYVKIPITFTNKIFTKKVLEKLISQDIKLNITAIFTYEQVIEILPIIKDTKSILSVFAGRIFDCGHDAIEIMKKINENVKSNSKCRTLWASPRMSYDYLSAINCGTDIITMQGSQIKKLRMFKKNLEEYSLDTIKQFYNDAKASGFKL